MSDNRGTVSGGFASGFGGCLGVIAAIILVCIVGTYSCAQSIRHVPPPEKYQGTVDE